MKENIKKIIKRIPFLWQVAISYNNFLNLFFRGNNLFRWYIRNLGHWSNVKIDGIVKFHNCSFCMGGGKLIIGPKSKFRCVSFQAEGERNLIVIGRNVEINATSYHPTIISACEGKRIYIGDNCLISNGVEFHTTDYHSILDANNNRTNIASDITIMDNVWIGLRCIILKGTLIADNNIVAAGSIVTSSFLETNCIIAGSPAKIIKKGCSWTIDKIQNEQN